jgi:glycosyltransferase involved in cell wall biosynthesis
MVVSAIIPAFNEEALIGETIGALLAVEEIDEIIVVDDGSTDKTAEIAGKTGAHLVLRQPENKGKGAALSRGATEARGEIFCFVDADLGRSALEFRKLLMPVLNNEADMTVARFPPASRPGGLGLVKGLAVWGIGRLSGYRTQAPLSGQRVLKRDVWEGAPSARDGFGVEVGLTVDCVRQGFTLKEIPVSMHHRESGRTLRGFYHRGRQFVQVTKTLLRIWTGRRVKL